MRGNVLARNGSEMMIDLNDLRVFAYVAALASFSLAAEALKIHKSSVSRSISRLEIALDTPLLQRTTRKVRLTRRGIALNECCVEFLSRISESIGYLGRVDAVLVKQRHHMLRVGTEVAPSERHVAQNCDTTHTVG